MFIVQWALKNPKTWNNQRTKRRHKDLFGTISYLPNRLIKQQQEVDSCVYEEAVYGRGTDIRGIDGRTNYDREKDVVPLIPYIECNWQVFYVMWHNFWFFLGTIFIVHYKSFCLKNLWNIAFLNWNWIE